MAELLDHDLCGWAIRPNNKQNPMAALACKMAPDDQQVIGG
jgi:hypothetical protein